jgi:GTP cyclohydrolase I
MSEYAVRELPDIQITGDTRGLHIDKVGVCDLRYPITVLDRENKVQHTVATLSLSVSLPHQFKGTHMSRFIEVLNKHRGEITMRTIPEILDEMRTRLKAESAQISVHFPYFIEKSAPVTGATSLMDYDCSFTGESVNTSDDFVLGVDVPVKTLCPCSKEISDYGAHNQRGLVRIEIRSMWNDFDTDVVWIEDLIQIAEESASAPLYALLKRPDERHVTMQAYDNPGFVEDIVRNVAKRLDDDERIWRFKVHAINQESIHNHNAFAVIEGGM